MSRKRPNLPTVGRPSDLRDALRELFAAAALTGLVSSALREPNKRHACDWSFEMADRMARAAVKRRRKTDAR